MLKGTVASLQVEMLNLKQALNTSEKIRTEQIKAVQNSVNGIKCDIQQCARFINDCIYNVGVDYGVLEATQKRVIALENFLDNAQLVRVEKCTNPVPPSTLNGTTPSSEVFAHVNSAVHSPCDASATLQWNNAIQINRQSQVISHGSVDLSNPISNPIPVRISTRAADTDAVDIDNEGFHQAVRRRTKRYFIGCYTNSLSIADLTSYVNSCGPTVTNVRVFPLRRSRNIKQQTFNKINKNIHWAR